MTKKKTMINTPERTGGSLAEGLQTLDSKKIALRLILILLPGLMPATLLRAQTSTLTLPDAVQIALKNNLGIRIAKNNIAIAGISNDYGYAGGLPVVSATATDQEQATSLKQVYSNPANNKSSNNAFSNSISSSLNGSMLLYNGQRVITAKKRLDTIEAQTRLQLSSRA